MHHASVGALFMFLVFGVLAGCGDFGSADDLVGVWARQTSDETPPTGYLDLKSDGSYRFDHDGMDEVGTYHVDGRSIRFSSAGLAYLGWQQAWRLPDRKHLVIDRTISVPGGQKMTQNDNWLRSARKPYFSDEMVDGQSVPSGLPELVNILVGVARSAYPDMTPAALQVSRDQGSGGTQIQVDLQSVKAQQGMHINVAPYSLTVAGYALRGNWGALPPGFIDLPQALALARKAGLQGTLTTASLNDWKGTPAWILAGNGVGMTIHAVTGAVLRGDVTGTIKSYNDDWAKAVQNLRRLAPRQFDSDKLSMDLMLQRQNADEDYRKHVSAVVCESAGGRPSGFACY